jgi:hypothetical protein
VATALPPATLHQTGDDSQIVVSDRQRDEPKIELAIDQAGDNFFRRENLRYL